MKTFEDVCPSELEHVQGGGALLGVVVVVGAAAVVGAFLYGKSMGSEDCPFTPK
jgi:lactobin A/cerein 7B family class IIb bacteriocin